MRDVAGKILPWLVLAVVAPLAALFVYHRQLADGAFLLLIAPLLWACVRLGVVGAVTMTVVVAATRVALEYVHRPPADGGWGRFLWAALMPVALYVALAWFILTYRGRQRHLRQQLVGKARLETLSRLAGGLIHDISNVLTVILGTLRTTQRENAALLSDSLRADLDMAIDAAQRGVRLTDQLLRGPAGEREGMEPLELNRVVLDAVRHIRPALGPDIELDMRRADQPLCILGNVTALYQVILNLTTNARDAMDGHGRIALALEPRRVSPEQARRYNLPGGQYAVLSVSDTGRGMSSRTLSRIFRPFFTTKPPGKSTGLGLVVVDSAVRQHRGFIEVQSKTGAGTTFFVYLPVQREPPDAGDHVGASAPARQG